MKEYTALASSYDRRWSRYTSATLKETLTHLPPLPNHAVVVDFACGTGALAEALSQHSCGNHLDKYIGVDISASMVQEASIKTCHQPYPFEVEWHVGAVDAELPFASGFADLLISTSSLHFLVSPEAMVSEAVRLLKAGGMFVCSDWCGDFTTCKLLGMWLRLRQAPLHKMFGTAEAEHLLTRAGLVMVSSKSKLLLRFWGFMVLVARRPMQMLRD